MDPRAPRGKREGPALIETVGLTKRFGDLIANDKVDFAVRGGEIHALLGENGSGKTTLLSMLYGLIRPDDGVVLLDGEPAELTSPNDARDRGVGMVPQRFLLVPTLTVAENVALAIHGPGRHRTVIRQVTKTVRAVQERYGLALDASAVVGQLSIGERQRVEIVRALSFDPRVLLLDEPTSVLTPDEAEILYAALRQMVNEEGRSVVLTTHRIREVFQAADRVTVLRAGGKVAEFEAAELSREALVRTMVGHRKMHTFHSSEAIASDRTLLRMRDVTLAPDAARAAGIPPVRNVNLVVAAGEILGVAGVEGNGQIALEMLLAGILAPSDGHIEVEGQVGYVPSDRDRYGVVPSLPVRDNLLLRDLANRQLFARVRTDAASASRVERLIDDFKIDPPSPDILVRQLSGGNAQKVVLAREISRGPAVTVAAQPTAGLDVAAASLIRARLHEQSRLGRAVVVISSDLDEILELCDRVTVMFRGGLVGSWNRAAFDRQEIGAMMAGVGV